MYLCMSIYPFIHFVVSIIIIIIIIIIIVYIQDKWTYTNTLIYKHIQLDYTQCTQNINYIYPTSLMTVATGKDGNCISSYQMKVQPPVEFGKNH